MKATRRMRWTSHLTCCLAALACLARASESPVLVWPDRLDFGQVRVGARVEGSVGIQVLRESTAPLLDTHVDAPQFLRIRSTDYDRTVYRGSERYVRFWVAVAADTARAGRAEGTIGVRIENQSFEVGVGVEVLPVEAGLKRVLVLDPPFNWTATAKTELLDVWRSIVQRARLDVNYLDPQRKGTNTLAQVDLSRFSVVLLSPRGAYLLSEADEQRLMAFVAAGGRLVITGGRLVRGSVARANRLLADCGVVMMEDTPLVRGAIEVGSTDIDQEFTASGINRLHFNPPSPLRCVPGSPARVLAALPGFPGYAVLVAVPHGKGEVVALGHHVWWAWIADSSSETASNALLWERLITASCVSIRKGVTR